MDGFPARYHRLFGRAIARPSIEARDETVCRLVPDHVHGSAGQLPGPPLKRYGPDVTGTRVCRRRSAGQLPGPPLKHRRHVGNRRPDFVAGAGSAGQLPGPPLKLGYVNRRGY